MQQYRTRNSSNGKGGRAAGMMRQRRLLPGVGDCKLILGSVAIRVREDKRALLAPERELVRIVLGLIHCGDGAVRAVLDVLEDAVDGHIRFLDTVGVDGPLVIEPEERAIGDTVRHNQRHHLVRSVRQPIEPSRVHDDRGDARRVDVPGGEVERAGRGTVPGEHRHGEGLVVTGDSRFVGVEAGGEANAGVVVTCRGDALDDARLWSC